MTSKKEKRINEKLLKIIDEVKKEIVEKRSIENKIDNNDQQYFRKTFSKRVKSVI